MINENSRLFKTFDDICGYTELEKQEAERQKAITAREKRQEQTMLVVLSGIFLLIVMLIVITTDKVKVREAMFKKKFEESSELRLSKQAINDGNIAYKIRNGKLEIYKKEIAQRRVHKMIGKVPSTTWEPYVKWILISIQDIPKYEGSFDRRIWDLEHDPENTPRETWNYH